MKVIGVIPARWGSTRFEGKVLAPLNGKPLIQHVWERAKKSQSLHDILIATDDQRVVEAAFQFGAKAVMTSKDHASGTDRISEVVRNLDVDVVVNIQGDEPLISHRIIDDLVNVLVLDPDCPMATVIKVVSDDEDLANPNVVKVVVDCQHCALYFSRAAIPFHRNEHLKLYYKHLGIYAYRKDFLLGIKDLPRSTLEETEKLEQLRVLEAGYKIKTVTTDIETIGVDTKEDLNRVAQVLSSHAE